jgi:uncharacterized protein
MIELNMDDQWKYVVLNPLAGNVNFLNEDFYGYLKDFQVLGMSRTADPAKDERLVGRGYVYRESGEEEEKTRQIIDDKNKTDRENLQNCYTIVPINGCSAGCSNCRHQNKLNGSMLSEADVEKTMDFIQNAETDAASDKKPILTIYGGDTMPDNDRGFALFKKIMAYEEQFAHIRIFTNGFNLQRYKKLLQDRDDEKLSFVFLIQATEAVKYGHEILSHPDELCIDWLRGCGISIGLIIKIFEDHVDKMPDYVNYLIGNGFLLSDNCALSFRSSFIDQCPLFEPCSIDYGLYEKIFRIYRDYPQLEPANFSGYGVLKVLQVLLKVRGKFAPQTYFCGANRNLSIFEPSGDVYTCYHALGNPELAVGNINNETIIDESKLDRWRKRSVDNIMECQGCPAKYLCGGGCAYEALAAKDSLLKPNCQPYESLIKWAFESLHEDFMESARYNQVQQEYAASDGE